MAVEDETPYDAEPFDVAAGLAATERRLSVLLDELAADAPMTDPPQPALARLGEIDRQLSAVRREIDPGLAGVSASPVSATPESTPFAAQAQPPHPLEPTHSSAPRFTGVGRGSSEPSDTRLAEMRSRTHDIIALAQAEIGAARRQMAELTALRETFEKAVRRSMRDCELVLETLGAGTIAEAGERQVAEAARLEAEPLEAEPLEAERVFGERVALTTGPFSGIGQVGVLERALLAIPAVERFELRQFAGAQAIGELHLSTPVRLLDELALTAPFSFEAIEATPSSLTLTVDMDRLARSR